MSNLFIDMYLDEDVDVLIGRMLRARGFSVSTTRDAGMIASSDGEQLAYACQNGMVLVTHNRCDFEQLASEYYQNERTHHGIIIAVRRPPAVVSKRLLAILNHVTAEEMVNQLRYI